MPYVGNPLANAFSSRVKQDLTGQSGTSFTLTHAVSSANDLSVYINHVRQEPTTAYTVDYNTLTTTGSVAGTDDFYIMYDELGLQSIAHDSAQAMKATSGTFTGAITTTQLASSGPVSGTTGTFSGAVDIQGQELILDADNDTSITADTDDQIDFKTGGTDRMRLSSAGVLSIPADGSDLTGVTNAIHLGASADMKIFHNANNNYILTDQASQSFTVLSDIVRFNTRDNGESLFGATKDGSFFAKYDNTTMFQTNTNGISMTANKGIDFANADAPTGGNPAETSTATVLDDYEEGTFTPYSNSVTGGSPTAVGMYVKAGNMVNVSVRFSASGASTNGHQFGIYLPFSAASTQASGSYNTWFGKGMFTSGNSNAQHRVWGMEGNNNYVDIRQQNASSTSQITGNSQGGSFGMHFSITYRTKD